MINPVGSRSVTASEAAQTHNTATAKQPANKPPGYSSVESAGIFRRRRRSRRRLPLIVAACAVFLAAHAPFFSSVDNYLFHTNGGKLPPLDETNPAKAAKKFR